LRRYELADRMMVTKNAKPYPNLRWGVLFSRFAGAANIGISTVVIWTMVKVYESSQPLPR
jgi:hypothetical protein